MPRISGTFKETGSFALGYCPEPGPADGIIDPPPFMLPWLKVLPKLQRGMVLPEHLLYDAQDVGKPLVIGLWMQGLLPPGLAGPTVTQGWEPCNCISHWVSSAMAAGKDAFDFLPCLRGILSEAAVRNTRAISEVRELVLLMRSLGVGSIEEAMAKNSKLRTLAPPSALLASWFGLAKGVAELQKSKGDPVSLYKNQLMADVGAKLFVEVVRARSDDHPSAQGIVELIAKFEQEKPRKTEDQRSLKKMEADHFRSLMKKLEEFGACYGMKLLQYLAADHAERENPFAVKRVDRLNFATVLEPLDEWVQMKSSTQGKPKKHGGFFERTCEFGWEGFRFETESERTECVQQAWLRYLIEQQALLAL